MGKSFGNRVHELLLTATVHFLAHFAVQETGPDPAMSMILKFRVMSASVFERSKAARKLPFGLANRRFAPRKHYFAAC